MFNRKDIRGICVKDHKFIVGVATSVQHFSSIISLFILSMVDE
jgi:hypothetical protein